MLEDLTKRYMEPHRKYHTLDHILKMFQVAKYMRKKLTPEMYWAIWFHDAVYNVKADPGFNEAESAELCAYWMEDANFSDQTVAYTKRLILSTATALEPGAPKLSKEQWVICGLDLYSFGNRCCSERIAVQLREEFEHVSEEDWVKGRGAFLQRLLDKEYIIHSSFFLSTPGFDTWHVAARNNISRELEILT